MKTCRKCGLVVESDKISDIEDKFAYQNRKSGKFKAQCRECERERLRLYRQKNKDKIKKDYENWKSKNDDFIKNRRELSSLFLSAGVKKMSFIRNDELLQYEKLLSKRLEELQQEIKNRKL